MDTAYLIHYGKGHLNGGHSGRYPWGSGARPYQSLDYLSKVSKTKSDIKYPENSQFGRYSNVVETGDLKGAYAFSFRTKDGTVYYKDAHNDGLGFENHDKIFLTRIESVDPVTIRSGKDVLYDLMPYINRRRYSEYIKELDNLGYFNPELSYEERGDLIFKSHLGELDWNVIDDFFAWPIGGNRSFRNALLDAYAKAGYDAIVDPEDYLSGYQEPIIIAKNNKFQRKQVSSY